jgi:hypothetical protein
MGSRYQNKDAAQSYLIKETIQSLLNKVVGLGNLKETTQSRLKERQAKFLGMVLLYMAVDFATRSHHETVFSRKTQQMCHMMIFRN